MTKNQKRTTVRNEFVCYHLLFFLLYKIRETESFFFFIKFNK